MRDYLEMKMHDEVIIDKIKKHLLRVHNGLIYSDIVPGSNLGEEELANSVFVPVPEYDD